MCDRARRPLTASRRAPPSVARPAQAAAWWGADALCPAGSTRSSRPATASRVMRRSAWVPYRRWQTMVSRVQPGSSLGPSSPASSSFLNIASRPCVRSPLTRASSAARTTSSMRTSLAFRTLATPGTSNSTLGHAGHAHLTLGADPSCRPSAGDMGRVGRAGRSSSLRESSEIGCRVPIECNLHGCGSDGHHLVDDVRELVGFEVRGPYDDRRVVGLFDRLRRTVVVLELWTFC